MLTDILKQNEKFNQLPLDTRHAFMVLAELFEGNPHAIYMDPMELAVKLERGNKDQWQSFLQLEPVRGYIKGQMGSQAEVAARKAFQSLTKEAVQGNVQAARQVNELAGIIGGQDANKIVVLHKIERPTLKKVED